MQQVVDVEYRDIHGVEQTLPESVILSEPRRAAKQPPFVGFPYQLCLPLGDVDRMDRDLAARLMKGGMVAEAVRPIFLKTDMKFIRLRFPYGNRRMAVEAYLELSSKSKLLFRNWK